MHPAVWFLILFLDIFAFTRLERVLEDKKRLDILKRKFLQERYLWTARSLNATEIRTLLQEKLVDPNAYDCKGGALNRIVNRSTKSAEMLDSVRAVLEHKDANPNGVGNHWAPLKIALARGHHEAAQVLLSHPKTKKEIDPAGLSCEIIAQLPDEVRLSYDPQCMCKIPSMFDGIIAPLDSSIDASQQDFFNALLQLHEIGLFDNWYFLCADSLNAGQIRGILKLVDPNADDCEGGALFRILNRSAESAEMLDSVRAVLEHKDANPNGVGNHWPPLKIALSRGHHEAAQVLLSHPRTKKEIDPAELSCELIEQLPDEVRLSYDPQCMCMIRTTFDNIMDAFSSIGIILDESSYDVCGWFPNVCNEFSFFIFWLRLPFSCFVIIIVSEQFIDTLFSRIGDHVFSMAGYNPGCIAVLLLEDL